MKARRIGGHVFRFLVNFLIMLFSLSCIFPMLWLLNSSLRENNAFMANNLALAVPPFFDNYAKALSSVSFFRSFAFSGLLGIGNVIFVILLTFVVGYFISRYDFRLKKAIWMLFLAGMVIPVLALLIPIFIQFKYLGMLNSPVTLLMTYVAFGMPFAVILVEGYVRTIPRAMDEAAYMEGCTTVQMLTSIIFPMCRPVMSILVITSFMGAWNEFPFSLVLINDPNMRTISLAIRMFNQEHTTDYTLYMAALFLTIIPVIIVYSIFSRRIMEGMTIGAVKG